MKQTKTEQNEIFDAVPEHIAEQFAVYRDGQLDKDYLKQLQRQNRVKRIKRAGYAVKKAAQSYARALRRAIRRAVDDVLTEIEAEQYDKKYGTNFREQLKTKRQRERDAAFAMRLGL
jgi:hypothetical protein